MAETDILVSDILAERQPPGKNADAIIAEMAGNDVAAMPDGIPQPAGVEGFDPELHESKDGKPVLNVDGTLKKKRGRKPTGRFAGGNANAPSETSATAPISSSASPNVFESVQGTPAAAAGGSVPVVSRELAKTSAQQTVGLAVALAVGIFGDEWKPDPIADHETKIDETAVLTDALAEYYFQQQFAGLTPGMAVTVAALMYGGRRVQRPKTKEKLGKFFGTIRRWIFGR